MCYLIAKKMDTIGCLAIQMSHGQHLADFKEKLISEIGIDKIQLVTYCQEKMIFCHPEEFTLNIRLRNKTIRKTIV